MDTALFSDVLAVKYLLPFVYTDMDYIIIIHIALLGDYWKRVRRMLPSEHLHGTHRIFTAS